MAKLDLSFEEIIRYVGRALGSVYGWRVALFNTSGTEIGTAAAPVRTDPTGTTTQPVSVTSSPLKFTPAVTADTGAGNSKAFTVPANREYELQTIKIVLISTATAGNRRVRVSIDDGTNEVFRSSAGLTQAASATVAYQASPDVTRETALVDTSAAIPVPRLLLKAGWRIVVSDGANIDASDTCSVRLVYGERTV